MITSQENQVTEACTESHDEQREVGFCSKEKLQQFLVQSFSDALDLPEESFLDRSKSLFDFDPNHLMINKLHTTIFTEFNNIPSDFIFQHPSIDLMIDALAPKEEQQYVDPFLDDYKKTQLLAESYIERAKNDFPVAENNYESEEKEKIVLLTGGTGYLGSHTLQHILKDKSVKKVYCLVRGSKYEALNRLVKTFEDFRLDTSLLQSDSLVTLCMDISDIYLGFTKAFYERLREEISVVLHCSWATDFVSDIEFFDQNFISPFYNLLKFAYRPVNPISVYFISSKSASVASGPLIEEKPLPLNARVSLPLGYSCSKFVCEVLLNYLTSEKQFPCYVLRLPLLIGNSENGVWRTTDAVSSMILACYKLRSMARIPIQIDWTPVDYAAKAISEIVNHTYSQKANIEDSVFNIFNRHIASSEHFISTMTRSGMKFDIVDSGLFLERILEDSQNPLNGYVPTIVAAEIFDTKNSIFDTKKAYAAAPILRQMPGFTVHLLKKYLAYWESIGAYKSSN